MINWKIRLQSKQFWMGLVGLIGTTAIAAGHLVGIDLEADVNVFTQAAGYAVSAIFIVLMALGIVADPTTVGLGDSERALAYDNQASGTETNIRGDEVDAEEWEVEEDGEDA